MPTSVVPLFSLYGEPPRAFDDGFVHIEDLDDRSRPAAWHIRPHAHADLHHLFRIRRGRGILTSEGETTAFEAPCALIVPAGVVHGFVYDTVSEGLVLTLSDAFLRDFVRREAGFAPLFESVRCLAMPEDGPVDAVLEALGCEMAGVAPLGRTAVAAQLCLLLVEVARVAARSSAAEARSGLGAHARIVTRFREAIEQHYHTGLSVNAYCERLGTTGGRLRIACRTIAGATPGQLITDRIILEAKRLLRYSDLSVSEIAYRLGFSDPAYFSRTFARSTGRAPSAFRLDA